MKVTDIIGNQCIRIFPDKEPEGADNVRALHLTRAFEARYGFYQGPRVLADYNASTGITFLRGQFQRRWIIDKFQFFSNGILVEGMVSTDELDTFLDEATQWAHTEAGLPVSKDSEVRRSYLSQIEVQADIAMDSAFVKFSKFGKDIRDAILTYGQNALAFEVSGISFNADLVETPMPKPGAAFIFARRENKSFNTGLYFSSAPLRSSDHLRFLETLQELLTGKSPKKASAS